MMIIKRLFQPTVIENEKEVNYKVTSFPSSEVEKLLSIDYVGGGVFGIENIYINNKNNTIFFCQPHFKVTWKESIRDSIFDNLTVDNDITVGEFYLTKPSIFPISMTNSSSTWNEFCSTIPKNIDLFLQLLLVYRQDNYKERLQEMYDDYCLNGIESPSNSRFVRKIQRGITEKIDSLLKWENNHLPIEEFENKINENCFRLNMRLIVKGDTERERKKAINGFKEKLNEYSYMNDWDVIISKLTDDTAEEIRSRKLNNIGKHQVFSASELIPFLTINDSQQEATISKEEDSSITENKSESLIDLLPKGQKLNSIDGKVYADKFNYALKEVKGIKKELKLKEVSCGATTIKLTFALTKGIKLSELKKKTVLEDLQIHIGVKELRIEQGVDVGEIDVYMPLPDRHKVFLRDFIDTDEFREFSKISELPILVGVSEIGKPIYKDLSKAPHLLIAGQTGSGKSKWLNSIITTLLLFKSPREIQMYMIDVKQVEFMSYKGINHIQKIITDSNEAIGLLKSLRVEMDRRYTLFSKVGVKDLESYNKKFPEKRMARILVFVDEFAELKLRNNDIDDYIQSFTQLSRASGIHLIIGTQRPSVDIISGTIKSNLPSKIAFKCANAHSYRTILNFTPKYNLLGEGDGILEYDGEAEQIRFQGCLIVDGDESDLIRKLSNKMKNNKVELKLPEIVEETDIEKLKRIIVQNNECRVSHLQRLMRININKLNSLMLELCEEEFLKAPEYKSQGYQLIADEDTINKYKEKLPQP